MPLRQSKITTGTIGGRPCEVKLNQILIDLDKPKITTVIMGRHQDLKTGLAKLLELKDRGFARRMMLLFHNEVVNSLKSRKDIPATVYTHALCCYKALYRDALRNL